MESLQPSSLPDVPQQNSRNSNIELLRIISMFLIVAFHMTRMGYTNTDQPFIVFISGITMGSWGLLGVDLFLITSAWFLVDQPFKVKRILGIVFQVFTYLFAFSVLRFVDMYSVTHSIAACFADLGRRLLDGLLQPLWSGCYWFVTAYFFLSLLSPLLNRFLNKVGKGTVERTLLLTIFIPIYAQFSFNPVTDTLFFVYVYLLVGYIKRYGFKPLERFASFKSVALVTALVVLARLILYINGRVDILPLKVIGGFLSYTLAVITRHSLILLVDALLLYFAVLKRPARHNKTINRFATFMLGVYLFHDNSMGPNMLNGFLLVAQNAGLLAATAFFPLEYLAFIVFVFATGLLVEMIRFRLIQQPAMRWMETRFASGLNKIDRWMELS